MAKPTRIVGIDYGMKRIGIAISDERKLIATPIKVFQALKKLEETVKALVKDLEKECSERESEIEEIVVGLPLMMSGKVGVLADEVKIFVQLLQQETSIPVVTWDERLTSVQAERSLMEGTMHRKKRTKHVDTVAAVIILQNYLDYKHLSLQ